MYPSSDAVYAQKLKTIESFVKGQEKERERLAKDLHDSVGANLAIAKIELINSFGEESEIIKKITTKIDAISHQVRNISHDLILNREKYNSFEEVLSELILMFQTDNRKIECDIFPKKEINLLPDKIKNELYKIIQELLVNANKHSKASNVLVNLTLHEDFLNLYVEDDGIGLEMVKIKRGIGLNNIRTRIEDLKGVLDLDSRKNKGLVVNINIPV